MANQVHFSADLNRFLSHSKEKWKAKLLMSSEISKTPSPTLVFQHLVMGNEALDLDSAVSSLLLAYLYHHAYNVNLSSIEVKCIEFMPLLPIIRKDLALRSNITWLFEQVGVDCEQLIFLDSVIDTHYLHNTLLTFQHQKALFVSLTDHNVLGESFEYLRPSLVGIIDHHQDQSDPIIFPSQEKEIATVGSTCTLVAERYLHINSYPAVWRRNTDMVPFRSNFDPKTIINPCITTLLIGTILFDTINLQEGFGKVTSRDIAVVQGLVSITHLPSPYGSFQLDQVEGRTELFESLQQAHLDNTNLSSYDLLRKDYKSFRYQDIKVGMSSVTLDAKKWLDRDEALIDCFARFYMNQELNLLVINSSYTDPHDQQFKRQLIFYCNAYNQPLLLLTLSYCSDKLILSPILQEYWATGEHNQQFFSQQDHTLSRKIIQPILHSVLIEIRKL